MASDPGGPSGAGEPTSDTTVAALGDELLRLGRRRTEVYAEARTEASAFRLLWVLADGVPRTQRELSAELGLDPSTVNRQVAAALAVGLLERFEVPGEPSKRLRPTRAGAAAYAHDGRLRAVRIAAALDELGAERTTALIDLLRRFNDAWDAAIDAVP